MGILRKIFGRKAAGSFDEVDYMTTRPLPVPDLGDEDKAFVFSATRLKNGYWKISGKHNMVNVTAGAQRASAAFRAALHKHLGQKIDGSAEFFVNFDAAFLILRDMEETLFAHSGKTPQGVEPPHHFMAAYRLLPTVFRENLDSVFFDRARTYGALLPPTRPPSSGPKPGLPPRN